MNKCAIFLSLYNDASIFINNCVFKQIDHYGYIIKSIGGKSLIINCVFNIENPFECHNANITNCIFDSNPKTHTLAHYTVESICDAQYIKMLMDAEMGYAWITDTLNALLN